MNAPNEIFSPLFQAANTDHQIRLGGKIRSGIKVIDQGGLEQPQGDLNLR